MRQFHPTLQRLAGTIGIWTMTLEKQSVEDVIPLIRDLDASSCEALWLPEAWGRESFTQAALTLQASTSLVVATGIANIWARDAVASSNAAKTLAALSHGRFVLGLGVSHQPLVERMRGHDYGSPVEVMRAYLEGIEKAPMHAPEGTVVVPRLIAALGPRMIDLAGELADGVHPYLVTPEHTASTRSRLGDKFIAVEQAVVLGGTREEYLRRAHEHLAFYTGLENYRNSWRRLGFTDDDFVKGGSDRLCEAMVIHGDHAAITARVEEHRQAGADHVCLQFLPVNDQTAPVDQWNAFFVS